MVSDYINIIRALMKIAIEKGISEDEIYNKLDSELKNKVQRTNRKGETRHIQDLINGRIAIKRLQRIEYAECQNLSDSHDIHGKALIFHDVR